MSVLRRTFGRFLADNCTGLAKEIAYSSLLAFFPALVALVGLLDLLNAYGTLRSFLDPVAPTAVINLLDTFAQDSGGGGSVLALVLGTVTALWAASSAMSTVVQTVNTAYELHETRPIWKRRLLALVLVLACAVVTVGLVLLVIFGGTLGHAIADSAGYGSAFTVVWNLARWPLAFVTVMLLFELVYYLGPNDARRWRWFSAGSALGAVSWVALSGLFALYTALSNSYTKTYGTLVAAIILVVWLNYTAYALLFGAELNAQLEREARLEAPPRTSP